MRRESPQTLEFWRGRLPHWEVVDGMYFITIHLAGAIPDSVRLRIQAMSRQLSGRQSGSRNNLQARIFAEMERWLDRTSEMQYLTVPDVANLIMEAIDHRSANGKWSAFEYVVMPNHVHLLVQMLASQLKSGMESFKRWTGKRAVKILGIKGQRFWQREWFDHWVRTAEEAAEIIDYIRKNPVKAGLVANHTDWPYGSWNRSQVGPGRK